MIVFDQSTGNIIKDDELVVTKNKNLTLIPLFSGMLLVLNDVLVNGVTPPVSDGQKYPVYWLLVLISSVGTNLLALYLGFNADTAKNNWKKLGRIGFYLVTLGLIGVILSVAIWGKFAARDVWLPWLPISDNQFTFASSMMVWYLAGPFLAAKIKQLSVKLKQTMIFVLSWFILVAPFIFGKPLWGITSAQNPIWVGTLFIFGILMADGHLKWLFDLKKTVPVMLIDLALAVITFKLIPIAQHPGNLTGRFFANYQLNLALFSLALFGSLTQVFNRFKILAKNWHWPHWFALITYFTTCLPIVNSRLINELHIATSLGGMKWLFSIFGYFVVFVVIGIVLTGILNGMQQLKPVQKLIDKFPINQFEDFMDLPQIFRKLLKENRRFLLVVALGFSLTVIQFFITNIAVTPLSWTLINYIFGTLFPRILLNVLIFICAFLLFFSLTNRYWPSLIFTSGLSVFITLAEFLKLSLRDEPILPTDLAAVSAFSDIAKMISPVIVGVAVVVLVFLIISSIVLQRHLGGIYPATSWKARIVMLICMLAVFTSFFWVNRFDSIPGVVFRAFNIDIRYLDQVGEARRNGPVVQFINNLNTKIMDEPKGYSKARIQNIMKTYNQQAKEINKSRSKTLTNQTIVFVLSESFSDPNRVPNLEVSPNPMSYLTSLKKKTDSGLMLSQGYGGGTANMEWQSLTGLSLSNLSPTLPTPYVQLVPKQKTSPAITDLFDTKIAVHPYTAALYNRKQVFKKFGFQKFYYQGSSNKLAYQNKLGTSPYVSDQSAYQDTLKVINQKQTGSKFIQLSTMQNHMPYNNYYDKGTKFKVTGSAYDSSKQSNVETYAQGIHYTDQALKQFIKKVDQIKKPVTVVWYGDHLASLYTSKLMSQYPIQLHETDYFIYNNQSHQLSYTNRLVSPYSFSSLALSNNDLKVTPYYALITKVTDDLPAMTIDPSSSTSNSVNGSNIFVGQNSKEIKYSKLSKHQKKLYQDYKLIEYDLVAGKQYSAHWAEQKIKN
jgi:phosphoglycerol transferase MdoB-like AlkP superfamily enzyme